MIATLFNDIVKAIAKWWKQLWFESRLKARLTMIEWENQIEAEIEREEQNKPIYIEHEIDPTLQTGESQKLGGAMELRAPWYTDDLQPKRKDGMQEAPSMDDRL
jgi:hypothetical protein